MILNEQSTLHDEVEWMMESYRNNEKITQNSCSDFFKQIFSKKSIPDVGISLENFMKELKEQIIPNVVKVNHSHFKGHMTGGVPDFMVALSSLVTELHQNMVKLETSNVLTFYERQALCMMHELLYSFSQDFYEFHIHHPESTLGVLCSGGTIGNVTALQCARNASLAKECNELSVEKNGLLTVLQRLGYQNSVVIGSNLMHYSFKKSAGILGLGSDQIWTADVDAQLKVKVSCVRKLLEKCKRERVHVTALVGVAGTTDGGSVDPLLELSELAMEFDVHFHVDAAWSGPTLFSDKYKSLLKGIDRADSITLDGHKQLYLPMGSGMVFFKNPYLAKHIEKTAEYIIRKDSMDLGRRSVEGSRPAHVFYLQAGLQVLGMKGYQKIIEDSFLVAREWADWIEQDERFELLLNPETNIVLFRCIPKSLRTVDEKNEEQLMEIDRYNTRIHRYFWNCGHYFVSKTKLPQTPVGGVALRIVSSQKSEFIYSR